jgi:hypothetical protein
MDGLEEGLKTHTLALLENLKYVLEEFVQSPPMLQNDTKPHRDKLLK